MLFHIFLWMQLITESNSNTSPSSGKLIFWERKPHGIPWGNEFGKIPSCRHATWQFGEVFSGKLKEVDNELALLGLLE